MVYSFLHTRVPKAMATKSGPCNQQWFIQVWHEAQRMSTFAPPRCRAAARSRKQTSSSCRPVYGSRGSWNIFCLVLFFPLFSSSLIHSIIQSINHSIIQSSIPSDRIHAGGSAAGCGTPEPHGTSGGSPASAAQRVCEGHGTFVWSSLWPQIYGCYVTNKRFWAQFHSPAVLVAVPDLFSEVAATKERASQHQWPDSVAMLQLAIFCHDQSVCPLETTRDDFSFLRLKGERPVSPQRRVPVPTPGQRLQPQSHSRSVFLNWSAIGMVKVTNKCRDLEGWLLLWLSWVRSCTISGQHFVTLAQRFVRRYLSFCQNFEASRLLKSEWLWLILWSATLRHSGMFTIMSCGLL